MINPNKFKPRNNWNVKTLRCKGYSWTRKEDPLTKIMREVSIKTRVPQYLFRSKTRKGRVVEAKYFYFIRAKESTTATLEEIGSRVSGGDHATVIYGIKQVNTVPSLKRKYNEIFNGLEPIKPINEPIKRVKKPEVKKIHLSLTGKPNYN